MVYAPSKRFHLPAGIAPGLPADMTVWDLEAETGIDSNRFLSKGKSTPFEGWAVNGFCQATFCKGNCVYDVSNYSE
jgi:dihydroorotase